ncbi:MAG: DUF445 domain-containing protein [Oligoflexus sp.]
MSISVRQAGEWNKSLLTNASCLALIAAAYVTPTGREQILNMGLFGLSGAVTNWLAIHMLFEKVPGLYGSGIIPNKFEDFKKGIEHLVMNQFFTEANLKKFIDEQLGSDDGHDWDPEPLIEKLDYDALFNRLVEAIQESPFGQMLQMFGGTDALQPLKEPFQEKTKIVIRELVKKDSFQHHLKETVAKQVDSRRVLEQVDVIVRSRLDELTPQMVKEIIQEMIRQHLGWLVVWGGFFGAFLGLAASFLG